jgi:valyl-tRNA synthetase
VVATTRPETMLGDTGVAVHPDDARYRHLVGKRVALPLVGRMVPIVADAAIDPAFGTGVVKMTPAHDAVDFEIAARHGLAPLDVMTPDARMNDAVPERFRGLDRGPPERRGSLLPLRHRGRAQALRSVVREDGAAGQAGARGLPERDAPLHP